MIHWELLSHAEALEIWDKLLLKFSDYNVQQSFLWGEFMKYDGWQPYRWLARNDKGEEVSLFQAVVRKYQHFAVLSGKGGPVGNIESWNREIQRVIRADLKTKYLFCRIYPKRQYDEVEDVFLAKNGWAKKLFNPKQKGLTMILDLAKDEKQLLAGCSKNWRHNLNRSLKSGLKFERKENPQIDKIYEIYEQMEDYKKLERQFRKKEIEKLFATFTRNIIFYQCLNQKGEVLSLRGCLIFGQTALDFFAASNVEGRKNYASYGVFWKLMRDCATSGIKIYDLNSIDPIENPGVYNFKKGTGAVTMKYLGEWDYFSHGFLKVPINILMYLKSKL